MGLEDKVDKDKYTLGDGFKTGLCIGVDPLGTFYSAQTNNSSVGSVRMKGKPVGEEVMHSNYSPDYEFGKYLGMGTGIAGNFVFGFVPQLYSALVDLGMYVVDKKKK